MIIPRCSDDKCTIADGCHCSGSEPPVEIAKRPQIVYLTFDDAFTAQAEEQFYRSVFDGTYKNPNGCTIRGTHFITQVASFNLDKVARFIINPFPELYRLQPREPVLAHGT